MGKKDKRETTAEEKEECNTEENKGRLNMQKTYFKAVNINFVQARSGIQEEDEHARHGRTGR